MRWTIVFRMKPPIFVRELSGKERERLEAGLRSKDAFVMRRCQILLASARGESPSKIAESLGCASQTVRNAIRAFNERGLDALAPGSSRPKHVHAAFDQESAEALRGMLHRSPREFSGAPRAFGPWRWPPMSLSRRASPQSASRGRPSGLPCRASFRFGGCGPSGGSPPQTPSTKEKRKKAARPADESRRGRLRVDGGFSLDECWWSRLAVPTLKSWSEQGEPLRLLQRSRSPKTIPSLLRPSPATGSICPRSTGRRGCVSSTAGPSGP